MIFGITGNINKPRVRRVILDFMGFLDNRGQTRVFARELADFLKLSDSERTVPLRELGEQCDMVLAFGGDGTLLSTVGEAGASGVPILGVNLGGMGFLAEVRVEELESTLEELIAGHYSIVERMLLDVQVHQSDGIREFFALNDVVIDKGTSPRLILVDVMLNDCYLNTYRSDGVIISTPTGSTAYSLSAGGPLLMPTMQAMIVTPICPHSLTVRPIVLSAQGVLKASICKQQRPAQVNIDGQNRFSLASGDWIEIRQAGHSVKWVSTGVRDFFTVLRVKLNWGFDSTTAQQALKGNQ